MSLYAVAKQAGISSEALYKWRDRRTTPSLYLVESISYVLNINPRDLVYPKDPSDYDKLSDEDKNFLKLLHALNEQTKEFLYKLMHSLNNEKQNEKVEIQSMHTKDSQR